jgi:hypothetical protein
VLDMARKKKEENLIVKPKLLITIVDRNKTEFYYDLIASLGSNMQIITHGEGTNNNQALNLMGLNKNKGVIFSIISEENQTRILEKLEQRFNEIKGGKGISIVVSLSSVIGVSLYQFMIDNRKRG